MQLAGATQKIVPSSSLILDFSAQISSPHPLPVASTNLPCDISHLAAIEAHIVDSCQRHHSARGARDEDLAPSHKLVERQRSHLVAQATRRSKPCTQCICESIYSIHSDLQGASTLCGASVAPRRGSQARRRSQARCAAVKESGGGKRWRDQGAARQGVVRECARANEQGLEGSRQASKARR